MTPKGTKTDLSRKVVKEFIELNIITLANLGTSLISWFIIAHVLSFDELGILGIINFAASLVVAISDFGTSLWLERVVVDKIYDPIKALKKVLLIRLFLTIISLLPILFIMNTIARESSLNILVLVYAYMLAIGIYVRSICVIYSYAIEKTSDFIKPDAIMSLTSILFLILTIEKLRLLSVIAARLIYNFGSSLLAFLLFIRPSVNNESRSKASNFSTRPLAGVESYIWGLGVVSHFTELVLSTFLESRSAEVAGAYSLSSSFSRFVSVINNKLITIAVKHRRQEHRLKDLAYSLLLLSSMPAVYPDPLLMMIGKYSNLTLDVFQAVLLNALSGYVLGLALHLYLDLTGLIKIACLLRSFATASLLLLFIYIGNLKMFIPYLLLSHIVNIIMVILIQNMVDDRKRSITVDIALRILILVTAIVTLSILTHNALLRVLSFFIMVVYLAQHVLKTLRLII